MTVNTNMTAEFKRQQVPSPYHTGAATPASPNGAIHAQAIRAGYGKRTILEQIDLQVLHGGVTALVGPNGSGKSTLLKVCTKLLAPNGGAVLLDGENIARLSTREMAKRLAILPQGPVAPANLTVRDLVEQGRYAQVGPFRMLRRQDHAAITRAERHLRMTAGAVTEGDGVRCDWPDGWVHVRVSRTEQVVRVISESETRELAESRSEDCLRVLGSAEGIA